MYFERYLEGTRASYYFLHGLTATENFKNLCRRPFLVKPWSTADTFNLNEMFTRYYYLDLWSTLFDTTTLIYGQRYYLNYERSEQPLRRSERA